MRKAIAGHQPLWFGVLLMASLAGCQQDRGATPRTEPPAESRETPLVKGDLSSLPELQTAPRSVKKIEFPRARPESRTEAVADRKKLLEKVSSENESLKKRIQQLESELEKKKQVSRRIDEEIGRLKQIGSR